MSLASLIEACTTQCLILLCIRTYIISNYLECYSFHVEKHRLRSQIDWTQDAWNQEYDMFFLFQMYLVSLNLL